MSATFTKRLFCELLGTFALVFVGTGAIIVDNTTNGTISHVGVSLCFGLVVLSMIYAFGDVSGCHINPAVTVGFYLAHKFEARMVLPYILSQLTGAVLASLLLRFLFPTHQTLGATLPQGQVYQSLILEVILSLILMLVILSFSTGSKEKGAFAGIAIGSVIAIEALFAGPISGASMNPARSIAPALVSGNFNSLWIYCIAPFVGVYLGVLACRCSHEKPCCCRKKVVQDDLQICGVTSGGQ
jgi:MIP family channel proteins